jgi:hypothetical protein
MQKSIRILIAACLFGIIPGHQSFAQSKPAAATSPLCSRENALENDLAEVNQQAADQFYAQALDVYGGKPMREFLYLQAYPFAWRETLNTPIFSFYQVPANFVTNQSLQRRFVQVALSRAEQILDVPVDESDSYRNKFQRALSTLALADVCLVQAQQHPKTKSD